MVINYFTATSIQTDNNISQGTELQLFGAISASRALAASTYSFTDG
jgi:hypothetical protein